MSFTVGEDQILAKIEVNNLSDMRKREMTPIRYKVAPPNERWFLPFYKLL
jgi:hypothetical protein